MPITNGHYRRPQLRNTGINYRHGWFFVTFQVAQNKSELGAIVGERCVLNKLGEAVEALVSTLGRYNPEVYVDSHVVMPNHVHLLLKIDNRPENGEHHLGTIIGKLKSLAAREYRLLVSEGAIPPISGRGAGRDSSLISGSGAVAPRLISGCGGVAPRSPVIISTFTSPQEREVLRRLIAHQRRFIAIYPGGIPETLPPQIAAAEKDGRALLMSPVPSGTGVNKQRAIWCNEYVIRRASRVWCGHITPGGTLHSILKALRPVQTLDAVASRDSGPISERGAVAPRPISGCGGVVPRPPPPKSAEGTVMMEFGIILPHQERFANA